MLSIPAVLVVPLFLSSLALASHRSLRQRSFAFDALNTSTALWLEAEKPHPEKNDTLIIDKAVYRTVDHLHPGRTRDVTQKVNELLMNNGISDLTKKADLNLLFGDPAPGVGKMLRVSRGSKFLDLLESSVGGPSNKVYNVGGLFSSDNNVGQQPSMFIAVLSRRVAATRRGLVRDMWMRAVGSSGNVTVRFALCDLHDKYSRAISMEQKLHGDILLLNCTEGYGSGALTRKVLAAMQAYRAHSPLRDLFMKVDDDTFVAWSRFASFLVNRGHRHAYIGVPIEEGVPCRNSSYRWYEPYESFNETYFPKAMAGGSGYTLGVTLVKAILDFGVGEQNLLWNEDRAVGVWIDKLRQLDIAVEFVAVNGIDGWWKWDWEHPMKNWATWADYPYMVHHGIHGETIACLALADKVGDPWQKIDRCFAVEAGETHEALVCAQETKKEIQIEKAHEDDDTHKSTSRRRTV